MHLTGWSARRIAGAVSRGETSAAEVAEAWLARARSGRDRLNGFSCLLEETALEQARAVDLRVRTGENPGPLAGVPYAVKDNICTEGEPTSCASRLLEGYRPPYDATAVTRMRRAGAVLLGKTNCDEFGMGSSSESSCHGPVRNPWNPERVAGGSSGGSAAVVADRRACLALGSDTGGSVRQPAAFCGVVGLKPTYGRVSRWGLVAHGSSLDQIGPLASDVADAALAFEAVAGPDPRDATCLDEPVDGCAAGLDRGPGGMEIGVPRECLEPEGLEPEVAGLFRAALSRLEREGARVREVSVPLLREALPIYYLLATSEASSNLARFDGVRYGHRREVPGRLSETYAATRDRGFGEEVRRRILLGTHALSAGYRHAGYERAWRARGRFRSQMLEALEGVDLLASPTSPTAAFRLGEKLDDPLAMYLSDVFTVPASLAGLPAVSVPCGRTAEGLPVGFQLVGPPLAEALTLRAARAVEALAPPPAESPS
jgi:aspartyl-tRNA(Asn)/glutamyl-tRNA(Gln) amidotransferase subunit A